MWQQAAGTSYKFLLPHPDSFLGCHTSWTLCFQENLLYDTQSLKTLEKNLLFCILRSKKQSVFYLGPGYLQENTAVHRLMPFAARLQLSESVVVTTFCLLCFLAHFDFALFFWKTLVRPLEDPMVTPQEPEKCPSTKKGRDTISLRVCILPLNS